MKIGNTDENRGTRIVRIYRMDLGFQLITQMKRKVGNTYPLRYARPPTLGGQPHPVAYGPSGEFSAFGLSGWAAPLR